MSSDENNEFEALVVLQFSSSTPTTTKNWVVQRLTDDHHDDDGGAGFLVRWDKDPQSQNNILLIGATRERLFEGAENLKLKKWDKKKGLRDFLIADIEQFENSENPSDILFKSEKQRIIWDVLQNLSPKKNEHAVPGVPTKFFSPENDALLDILRDLDFIQNFFPLHDKEELKLLERDWFKSFDAIFKPQDIHKVRNYFGDNVAFYFAFLEHYTKALIPTALFGIFISFWPSSDFFKYAFFCVFNVLWWTIFMERWKRLTNRLAYQWGSLDLKIYERPRSLYQGELQQSPITGLPERRYPRWKRTLKKYFVSYPIVATCIAISLWIYFTYYGVQQSTNARYPLPKSSMAVKSKVMRFVPSASYSLIVIPIKAIYQKIARFVTDFENHRLQTSYENNLTAKLFIFFFVNCFVGLFYEAFFIVDFNSVAQLLTSLVIVNAFIGKFTEQVLPYFNKELKREELNRKEPSHVKISEAVHQAKTLTPFNGTYSDYLTIFEQYGYVALFSAVFPWITICALISNIFELRADAFKYCHVYQRSFARLASNIGSWHYAFDILSSVSIVTNTALIAMQPSVREYFSSYTDVEYILIFVAAEHVLLALKFAIDFAIPDVPYEVQIARAKNTYESHLALINQRKAKAKSSNQ